MQQSGLTERGTEATSHGALALLQRTTGALVRVFNLAAVPSSVGRRETRARSGRTVAGLGENLDNRLKTRGELAHEPRKPAPERAVDVVAGSHGADRGHNEISDFLLETRGFGDVSVPVLYRCALQYI